MQMTKQAQSSWGKSIAVFMVGYGLIHAVLVALLGLALNLRMRTLILPYLLLLWCGFVAGTLILWARQADDRPQIRARRFAFAIFAYLCVFMGALLLGAVMLGLLSRESAVENYAPYVFPGSVTGALLIYILARRR